MEKAEYHAYLASRDWNLLKNSVKARSKGICERCRLFLSEHVHHVTYERLGKEKIEDLLDLCDGCHKFVHAKSNEDPIEIWNTIKLEREREENRRDNSILQHHHHDEYRLLCPECSDTYTHVQGAFSLRGNDDHEASKEENVYGLRTLGSCGSRRDCLVIEVQGECGHAFLVYFQQHKGETFVSTEYLADVDFWTTNKTIEG